jgi:hypothetical protein
VVRTTKRQSVSPEETEEALRLLAANSKEWCTLGMSATTGEELWRVKTQDVTVCRFVRQTLVAMREGKL